MDQLWQWLSTELNPFDLSQSGQQVLQTMRNIWQEEYRDYHSYNLNRSIYFSGTSVTDNIQIARSEENAENSQFLQHERHITSLPEESWSSVPEYSHNICMSSMKSNNHDDLDVKNIPTCSSPANTRCIDPEFILMAQNFAEDDVFANQKLMCTDLSTFKYQHSMDGDAHVPLPTGSSEKHKNSHANSGENNNVLEMKSDRNFDIVEVKELQGNSECRDNDRVMSGRVSVEELNQLLNDSDELFHDIPDFIVNGDAMGKSNSDIPNTDTNTTPNPVLCETWQPCGGREFCNIAHCNEKETSTDEGQEKNTGFQNGIFKIKVVSHVHRSNKSEETKGETLSNYYRNTKTAPLKESKRACSMKSKNQNPKETENLDLQQRKSSEHLSKNVEQDELCNKRKYPKCVSNFKNFVIPDMFLRKQKKTVKFKQPFPHYDTHKNTVMSDQLSHTSSFDGDSVKKKKQKFEVPYKKEVMQCKEGNEMNEASKVSVATKYHITTIDMNSLTKLENIVEHEELLEVGLTIIYREGFCQLNQSVDRSKLLSSSPNGIMLSLSMESKTSEYFYVSLNVKQWRDIQPLKNVFLRILRSSCRKICFKAQEILILLIKIVGFNYKEACMNVAFLDSLVGCWLLDPDHPAYDFATVKTKLGCSKNKALSNEPHIKVCQLLQQLSEVMEILYQRLEECGLWKLFLDMEMKIIPILAVMECHGICVEKKRAEDMGIVFDKHLKKLQASAYETAGKQFQLNSTLQLRKILYDDLKLDQRHNIKVKETSAIGAKSTSEPMLRLLVPLHPLPGIILEYRHLQKVKSTYIDAILEHIKGERIFSTWELTSAATGRITSSNPNLQSLPKQPIVLSSLSNNEGTVSNTYMIRSPYQPQSGFSFLAADFQHIELRIFAHLSQDASLLSVFQEPGDIFLTLAQMWLGKNNDSVGFEDREKTKRIVYAVMYGAGAGKVAEFLHIETSEASHIINSFMGCFPTLRTYPTRIVNECHEKGYLQTIGGRRRLFPNITSSNPVIKTHTERQAINFVIQGSAADVCKAFMLHTEFLFFTHSDIEAHLVLQIHDELVWEVKDTQVDTLRNMIETATKDNSVLCKHIGMFSIPLLVSITTGKNLADMKK